MGVHSVKIRFHRRLEHEHTRTGNSKDIPLRELIYRERGASRATKGQAGRHCAPLCSKLVAAISGRICIAVVVSFFTAAQAHPQPARPSSSEWFVLVTVTRHGLGGLTRPVNPTIYMKKNEGVLGVE